MRKSSDAYSSWGVLFCAILTLCGCPQEMERPDTSAWSECTQPDIQAPPATVTYHQHIKPLVDKHCVGCHQPNGPSPFALDTYEALFTHRNAAQWAISTGSMPPWFASDCCRDYSNDISLSETEKTLFEAWMTQGATEGAAVSMTTEHLPKTTQDTPNNEIVIQMPKPWVTGKGTRDFELRCMLLDWPATKDLYITSFGATPGNKAVVHHVLASIVPPSRVKSFEARDAQDPELGWDCYGEGGNPTNVELIGGWVPGMDAVHLPAGLGMRVPKGSKILFEVHYDLSSASGSDQTSFTFNTQETVKTPAQTLTMAHPLWLVGDGMSIPANEVTTHDVRIDIATLYDYEEPVVLYGTSLHMHDLGAGGTLALQRADGSWECLLHQDDFEFGWQGLYYFKEPVTIYPGDELYLACEWDNRASNQPDGQTPKTLKWGTDGEMCSAFLLVANQP